jgi:hypothetical protein
MNVIVRPAIVDFLKAFVGPTFRRFIDVQPSHPEGDPGHAVGRAPDRQLADRAQTRLESSSAKMKSGWQIRWADKIELKNPIHFRRKSFVIINSRIRNPLK